jgi:hypothetical protein
MEIGHLPPFTGFSQVFEVQIATNGGAAPLVQADLNRTPCLGGFVT